MSKGQRVSNRFFCLSCGREGISLARPISKQREKSHRKKLYCIYCKEALNHIECKNEIEVKEFKEDFERGVFINEAKESLYHVRSSGFGKEHMGAFLGQT